MDERVVQLRVGLMVLATVIITAILIVMFGELPKIIHGTYTIHIWLREAPGVMADTPVRKSGLLIGRVTRVEFAEDLADPEVIKLVKRLQDIDEDEFYAGVVVTAEIEKGKNLYPDEFCRVSSSLLGDAVLQIVRPEKKNSTVKGNPQKQDNPGREKITNGQWIRGTVADDPIDAITDLKESLSKAIGSVTQASVALTSASNDLGKTVRKVGDLLEKNEEGINAAVAQASSTMEAVAKAADAASALIGDEETQRKLKSALDQLPQMLAETRETVARMKDTMVLVDRNLRNVEKFTQTLGDEELINRLDRGTQNLDRLMSDLSAFGRAINNQQGSLGQLVHNPELYQHLNRAARNIDDLTRQLEPIVKDARVFTDKIARHPESLGVRGALQRSPGIK